MILWFSGNGANASGNLENARRLMERLDVAIVCVDYRGYGLSEGSPTESGLYQDGRAVYDLVRERGVPPHRIVLLGRSLGSAIAADVALDRPSGALVLETPFLSVADVAKVHYPFIPRFLIKTRYDTASKLARIAVPTLIVQAERDELFPPNHAARLYELSAGSPKHLHVLAGSRHNDVFREQRESYFSAWRDLLTALPRAAGS
ncbi:MAG TPA: alpha/beta fold hydrolase [Chloroflexota bacterium]|nr:alpha/beta fold hydrolase [Chloroflexota bacterium]